MRPGVACAGAFLHVLNGLMTMKQPRNKPATRTFGVIGGLGSLAGGDLFLKLLKCEPLLADQGRYHLLFEQRPFSDLSLPLASNASMTSRKLYVFHV